MPNTRRTRSARETQDEPTLEEQLAEAIAERDRLRQEQALRNVREEIDHLRTAIDAPVPDIDPDPPGAGSNNTPSTFSEEPRPAPVHVREIEPEKLQHYNGKSTREHREWVRSATNAFRLAPQKFHSDNVKIGWAAQFLRGTPYATWSEHEEAMGPEETPTWTYFTTFLLDQIEDPVNRGLDALLEYEEAKQRDGQSTVNFNTYLMGLESQLPDPLTESQKRNALWAKLRPDMRAALGNLQHLPTTRDAVVATATRLEKNKKRLSEYQSTQTQKRTRRNTREAHHTRESSKDNPRPPTNSSANSTSTVRCYNCQGLGHYANKCPQPKAPQKPGQRSSGKA